MKVRHRAIPLLLLLGSLASAGAPLPDDGGLFRDVSNSAGVDFTHVNGASGERYFVETMGSGACWLDYDGDGRFDLYAVNSAPLPGYGGTGIALNRLYKNLGGGRFRDVTGSSGAGDDGYGMGCTAADFDNDGDTDLYVTNFGPNVLYRNDGLGRFEDVTAEAGVGDPRWSASAAFADIDNDSDLDLYVTNYLEFTLAIHKQCGDPDAGYRAYCSPAEYAAAPDSLYRNNGDGTFTEISVDAGVARGDGKGLGVVFSDLDDDGWQDIYVANDQTMNFLFHNRKDGTFEDVSLLSLTAFSESGEAQAGMGTDAGDVNGDGRMDLVVTNLDYETNELYLNGGGMSFTNSTFGSGLGAPDFLHVGFGADFLDYDNDGDQDFLVVNGHVIDNIHLVQDVVTYAQPRTILQNQGKGLFGPPASGLGKEFLAPDVGRGLAVADMDDDGDLDFFVTNSNRKARLFRNEGIGSPSWRSRNWIGLILRGTHSNRDGVGARVRVGSSDEAGEVRWQVEQVKTGSSYMSQNDARLHFGLGRDRSVKVVEIRWPSGQVQRVDSIKINQYQTILEQ